jgi:hypothetical protein
LGDIPRSPIHDQTVKSFEQRELHGTVTIRPELKLSHQKVMQK